MLPTSDGLLRSERLRFPLASGSIAPRKVTLLVGLVPTSAALLAHRCSFCIGKRPAANGLEGLWWGIWWGIWWGQKQGCIVVCECCFLLGVEGAEVVLLAVVIDPRSPPLPNSFHAVET